MLNAPQRAELRCDLSQPPSRLGYEQSRWSGNLLARHLARNYGVTITVRHCRRILSRVAPPADETDMPPHAPRSMPTGNARASIIQPTSSYPNLWQQQQVLKRMRRLASSGLSTVELAMAVFDTIADAVPASERKAMHFSGTTPVVLSPWIARNIDWKSAMLYEHYVTERSAKERGIIDPLTLRQKPVYRDEEVILPGWDRSETYNDLYRHWDFHHVLYVWAMDGGQFMGGLPIWRSAAMRPFTTDDVRFATAASALIGHALRVSRGLESRHAEGEEFVAAREPSAGVILITDEGRILAVDREARRIFTRTATFDGVSEQIVGRRISPFLRYLGRTLREIFSHHADGGAWLPPPSACLFLHRSGIALRFHGFVPQGQEGKSYFSVLVEAGELAADRRRRLMLRYGLSPRQFDVLRVIGHGRRGREAAAELDLGLGTFYKYAGQLQEKLGIADSSALRTFAQETAL